MLKKFLIAVSVAAVLPAAAMPSGTVAFADSVLTVSFPTENTHTITYQFRKCMANDIFTFCNVWMDSTLVNSAIHSDNIGPFMFHDGGWAGGNHLQGDKKTARTVAYRIEVDGKPLEGNAVIPSADRVDIYVYNELFDPYIQGGIFDNENVHYTVAGNSIQVDMSHTFRNEKPYTIDRYYGMQSMMIDETETLTPAALYTRWTPIKQVSEFKKRDYPDLRLFVEHSPACYQAAFMTREGLGDRHLVSPDDIVFIGNSWSKSYHKLIGGVQLKDGDSAHWKGIYTWFVNPVIDNVSNNGAFAYQGFFDGNPAIFYASDSNPGSILPVD